MRPNLGYYVQKINDLITETEKTGEAMHPYFEEVRQSLDEKKTISADKIAEVEKEFQKGLAKYLELSQAITALQPPVKVIGIHKKLEKSFQNYVAGCKEMTASLDAENGSIDEVAFNQSEEKQDQATEVISFCIQKMTTTLMK
ncbi:hypothetical protein ACFFIF_00445 [Vagococcus entomophilus]|uniref:Chemotaxis protein n=1 Tax=Vagococcus entomophilus TaxID=1160095 RepID=A0A430AKR1_9ENTE|nr:hypothetical protein [Vagococcus entomophilus]RSU08701.1 hypothetical protein CBF30_05605 [Vagococcus entomophilus]